MIRKDVVLGLRGLRKGELGVRRLVFVMGINRGEEVREGYSAVGRSKEA